MQAQTRQKTFKLALAITAIVALAAMSSTAYAGTATSSMAVSATVANNCTISNGGVAFGTYDPIVANATTDLAVTGTITTTCTNGASVTVGLDQGAHAGTGSTAAAPVRRMLAGTTNYLSYQLYTDSAHTTVWNATGPTVSGTGAAVATTVYALATKGQNVPTGSYADTVVATVTF
ncbi:spore coat U domain-containing protein [Frateuria sp.]|uniref:Csu type fimbrial protein n=1 Tax=Frateuria sp. TaxID=2211372 RepID=UPI0017FDDE99|nr:spore coat U domain-containing protein [Frateuria sp.]NUR21973.1 spore coat protein U domain-containing protein [Frateuria sp.]